MSKPKKKQNEYGCVMLFFDFPYMFKIQDIVNPKDWYEEEDDDSYGMDKEPYISLLFGLHEEVTVKQIKKILDGYTFGKCTIKNPSLFENEKYDVFKFEVSGKSLNECNEELKTLPYTSDFPKYNPHMTIGYLMSGKGKKYVKMLEDSKGNKFESTPKYAVYSMTNGVKIKIPINLD